jgi:uncharacterized membrane protein YdjX (TVP38/TMEM64 family)
MRQLSPAIIRSFVIFSMILFVAGVWIFSPLRDYATVENIQSLSRYYHDSWAAFAVFVLIFALGNFFFLPIPLISFAASLMFPFWMSLLCGSIGLTLASILGYQIGRIVDVNHWPRRFRKFGHIIESRLHGKALWPVVLLRLAPTPPFTVTSVVAGSCRVQMVPFLFGSLLGVWPLMLLVNMLGVRILSLIKEPSTITVMFLLTLIGMALLFLRGSKKIHLPEKAARASSRGGMS